MNKIIAIPADGKIVLSFFMRGYLLSPFSLIVRSFDQDSFGHLAKFHSVVWPNQHVTSVVLPNPSLQIGFRCLYNKVYVTPASR